jgi:membrane protein implicated in regulation of membrane protease activity
MQDYEWWWVIAGALGVAEVLTGTFYVLVLAIAAIGASLLAKAGLAVHWQALGAALVALVGWFWLGRRRVSSVSQSQELDIGEWVEVESWSDGVGSTMYRGVHWSVEMANLDRGHATVIGSSALKPGKYRIQALRGNRLIVDPSN